MGLREYFDMHTTQRWYFKHGCVLAAGALITLGLNAISAGFIDIRYAPLVSYALNMANDRLRIINPDAPWSWTGAQANTGTQAKARKR